MLRKIIKINEEKCNGCGLCAQACHEGAIGMVNNKAVLLRDDYCDGLGDCLPVCPTNAISFENREAAEYDKEAVEQIMKKAGVHFGGCPGSNQKVIIREQAPVKKQAESNGDRTSKLRQWPLQIKLVNPAAGFLQGADLLIAADCTAYAYGN
ncbi:MAG: 4Fe-4S ferredoxin iron-sulfur binding protein, partial [Oscillospiraceae bacterium]|nr:4Fe-4S ferredoxin iron-sulfur binding protein [Oscillospiraceae bacterium]